MKALVFAVAMLVAGSAGAASDDVIAMRLFDGGRFAEAAELFTSPAWKGVAFYRSEQDWRAVEAFLRAGDVDSTFNLGNAYARLGYLELALQAYLTVLSARPDHADAAFNADLIRNALTERERSGQAGIRPQAREIDRLDAERKKDEGAPEKGEQGQAEERQQDGANFGKSKQADEAESMSGQGDGEGTDAEREQTPAAEPGNGASKGRATAAPAQSRSGSTSTSGEMQQGVAVGKRAELEAEQATAQWLNGIVDDPGRFLKARIALEARRRAKAGVSVSAQEDAW